MLATPSHTYHKISALTSKLLSVCERHNIVVWLEYGSLLGWCRHRAPIPWDYDGDFGIRVEDRAALLEAFRGDCGDTTNTGDDGRYILDQGYYNDEGCLVLRYVDNMIDVIDIIFYREDGDQIRSCQNDLTEKTYPCAYCYRYEEGWLYPLTKSLFLGHTVYVPAKPERMLDITYGDWSSYPKEFEGYIEPRFLTAPTKTIPELASHLTAETITAIVYDRKMPFIIRDTRLLKISEREYGDAIGREASIYGYNSSITWEYESYSGADIWSRYRSHTLDINIVDSPVTEKDEIDREFVRYVNNKRADLTLCWILTNAPKITHFHTDPAYGGGYMKILEGEKIWWCIMKGDWEHLVSKGHSYESLREMDLCEIIELEGWYLWGRIYVDMIKDGDLIWFPVDTLHKVLTTRDSYGFGGYV